ncbi:fibronectin type III domain-containing protein [Marinobacter lipolyticus]|uniref:fibronectin type III domain-containing protein n=1 Tax=Marinobacter lipolyticus TaxID=209639 RepID=UPI001D197EAA|nr:fibronectin type III domain-containing protein [Marinobacter lipolyticus]
MNRVIKMSQISLAALVMGVVLTGCGGGGSGGGSSSSDSVKTGSPSPDGTVVSSVVGDEGDRTADLSWNAPMTRVNNESLKMGELAGYVITYGKDRDDMSETIRIDSAATMEYTVSNLDTGTWYFTIQAEDVDGLISDHSGIVSKEIRG